ERRDLLPRKVHRYAVRVLHRGPLVAGVQNVAGRANGIHDVVRGLLNGAASDFLLEQVAEVVETAGVLHLVALSLIPRLENGGPDRRIGEPRRQALRQTINPPGPAAAFARLP